MTASSELPEFSICVIQVSSGVTTSSVAQDKDLATRTSSFTFAGASAITGEPIPLSSDLKTPTFTTSQLSLARPWTGDRSSLSLAFALNANMAIADTIQIGLPFFTYGNLVVSGNVGCGSTTFAATGALSGTAQSFITLTVASSSLPAAAMGAFCKVSIASGVTNSAKYQV